MKNILITIAGVCVVPFAMIILLIAITVPAFRDKGIHYARYIKTVQSFDSDFKMYVARALGVDSFKTVTMIEVIQRIKTYDSIIKFMSIVFHIEENEITLFNDAYYFKAIDKYEKYHGGAPGSLVYKFIHLKRNKG